MNSASPAARAACVAAAFILASVISGCALGPDFQAPAAPESAAYTRTSLPHLNDAQSAQRIEASTPFKRNWWDQFQCAALSQLVTQALAHNPSITAAQAALRQASENAAAQRGFFLPSASASFSPSRQRFPVGTLAPDLSSGAALFNLYTAQLTVGYVPDVFGGNRRAVESLEATEEAQRDLADATALTLASNVVVAAIQAAALREEIAASERVIRAQEKTLEILRSQVGVGYAAGSDLAVQEMALAQARASLPPLRRALEQTLDLVAALAGSAPDRHDLPEVHLSEVQLPASLPLVLPADLVAKRPDVRAALAQLHAASASIGVAVAAQWPQFAINGSYGGTSTRMSQLFSSGNVFWSIVAGASQSIFDGGTLLHRKRAAEAAFDEAAAQYQSTVIVALQNVADSLYALDSDADLVRSNAEAKAAAARLLDLNQKQLSAGYSNALALLLAEQGDQAAQLGLIQAQANQLMDTVALYQALGGGWD